MICLVPPSKVQSTESECVEFQCSFAVNDPAASVAAAAAVVVVVVVFVVVVVIVVARRHTLGHIGHIFIRCLHIYFEVRAKNTNCAQLSTYSKRMN